MNFTSAHSKPRNALIEFLRFVTFQIIRNLIYEPIDIRLFKPLPQMQYSLYLHISLDSVVLLFNQPIEHKMQF